MRRMTYKEDMTPMDKLCIEKGITRRELDKVQAYLFDLGLDGFVQSRSAKGSGYIPDFQQYARKRANPQEKN